MPDSAAHAAGAGFAGAETAVAVVVVVFAALVGAALGSFLGVVVERVPRRESIGGRSRCVCGRLLPWYENLPVVSWLALRGRARCCGAPIPAWYLALEVGCALVGVASVLAPGPWWAGPLGGVAVLVALGAAGVTRAGVGRTRL